MRGLLAFVSLLALVAGLPWALGYFAGWPLPDHIPSWEEFQATLLNPMSAGSLLDILAVLCWIVWFFFTLDVLRCSAHAARGITWPQVRPPGPMHGLAAALIGAIVLALLGSRAPPTASTTATVLASDLAPVAVVAPLAPDPAGYPVAPQAAGARQTTTLVIDRAAPAPAGTVQVTEEIRLPHHGIYDSLWRVAERIHGPGAGSRWPELFQLNRGVEQPDGRTLINPNLVRPGWKIRAYIPAPLDAHAPVEQRPPSQAPPTIAAPPSTEPTLETMPAPVEINQPGEQITDQAGPGLDLLTGAFVSIGLAGVITAAMVSARMWRRRHYRIGSGDRADLHRPIAPVVRALRTAHDDDSHPRTINDSEFVDLAPVAPQSHITAASNVEPGDEPMHIAARVGVRGDRELALNVASSRGLGLAGPGATAAARALLLHLLAEQQPGAGVCVVVPAADLHLVFEEATVAHLPRTVRVVESLDIALNEMEAALLTRARHAIEETATPPTVASLVLLGSPAPYAQRRLQAVLDNGSTLGLAGILIGQWRPGATVRIRHDGTVSATSPGLGDTLAGTRLFTMPATDATELLAVLREAEAPADRPMDDYLSAAGDDERREDDRTDDHDVARPRYAPNQCEAAEMTQLELARLRESEDRAATADIEPADAQSPLPAKPSQPTNGAETEQRRALIVRVLGRVHLAVHDNAGKRELSGALTAKQREVLVHLALHPHGVRREVLNDAIWPDSRPPRPYNSFHNTLSMLRRALNDATGGQTNNIILNKDGRYQLNNNLVIVDFWQLQHAMHALRSAGNDTPARLLDAIELYQGDLAEDLLAPWIESYREALRRDLLDALGALIRARSDADPGTILTLLERTRQFDRYNEGIYRDIIRTQARLGLYAAIPRTLALLTATLDEISQRPTDDTLNLVDFLQRRGSSRRERPTDNAAAS